MVALYYCRDALYNCSGALYYSTSALDIVDVVHYITAAQVHLGTESNLKNRHVFKKILKHNNKWQKLLYLSMRELAYFCHKISTNLEHFLAFQLQAETNI